MFTDNQPHLKWEMPAETQHKFAIGVVVVAGLLVLMNLIAGASPSIWDQLQPGSVAHRIEMIRFS